MNDQGLDGADEVDAVDIRLMLQGVLTVREPEQRDLAGPAVSVVLRGRKRMRVLTYAASAVALVVLGGAVALGAFAGGGSAAPAATTATPPPAAPSLSVGERTWAKQADIRDRLPELLNAVLPAGYRLSVTKDERPDGPGFVLTGPTGTNSVSLTAFPAAAGVPELQGVGGPCVAAGGRCSSRSVSGGTLYVQLKDFPANYGGACCFQKGHETDVLSFDDQYAFVPASGRYSYVVNMTARQAYAKYGDRPRDWPTDSPWPPAVDQGNVETTFDAAGALLSEDQFVAMVTDPAMAAVGELLDGATPPSPAAVKEFEQADATIQATTKDLLPAGLKLSLDGGAMVGMPTGLVLTGPSGADTFQWQAVKQLPTWEHGWACETHTEKECKATDVPGGELSVTTMGQPTQVSASGTTPVPGNEQKEYAFLPDDRNGTVVRVILQAQSPSGGVLLTPEQFLALAKDPGIAAAVAKVNGFLHLPS